MITSYNRKVREIASTSLVAYWPMNERSGTTVYDWSSTGYHGTSTNVSVADRWRQGADGGSCYRFDGSTSYVNIYTALAVGVTTIGSISVWFACEPTYLNGTTLGRIFTMSADANNAFILEKTATANTFRGAYIAGGTTDSVSPVLRQADNNPHPEWHHLGASLTVAGDMLKIYVDGAQSSTTQTGLGTWAGAIAATLFCIGSGSTVPANVFNGWLQHMAIWSTVLTDDEFAELGKIGP